MGYKWKPSKSQRKAFAERMQDPIERTAYETRKVEKAAKRRETSSFDYDKAGGEYVPTKEQYLFVFRNLDLFKTPQEKNAAEIILSGYSLNEKVHHDFIHIVNEIRRTNPNI